jgi:NAD(P)-dependent dehydrogenase (short-subunit alcohol dehydrogenase family)
MPKRVEGQIAWISGGASGMGQATAELFVAEGAAVAIADVQAEQGEALAREITKRGGKAIFTRCDVSSEAEVRESIERTAAELGGLQTIINCAGIVHTKPLDKYSVEEWDQLMGVNVKSIFLSIKHGLKYLSQHRRSYVVNVGSISSFVGQSSTPAYTTSKGAVLQLTRSIALDYAAMGLRCNCVCPGITDTPLLRHHLSFVPDPEGLLRERLRRVPTGVVLTPPDIAKAILYLSCEDSSGVTGTSLVIDGGYISTAEWQAPEHTAFMDPI